MTLRSRVLIASVFLALPSCGSAGDTESVQLDAGSARTDGGGGNALHNDPIAVCHATHDTLGVKVSTGGYCTDQEIVGVVVSTKGDTIEIDPCAHPECGAARVTLQLIAAGLSIEIPEGTIVRATIKAEYYGNAKVCARGVGIVNLPEWNGLKNPNGGWSFPWVVAGDGMTSPPAQVVIDRISEPCTAGGGSAAVNDEDSLRMRALDGASEPEEHMSIARMGETVPYGAFDWAATGYYLFHNLRSLRVANGPGDDYDDLAYWIAWTSKASP